MKTHYWQNVVDKTVTKTSSSRKPSILHKRITKSAYETISGLTKRAADGAVCTCGTVELRPHIDPLCPSHGNSPRR